MRTIYHTAKDISGELKWLDTFGTKSPGKSDFCKMTQWKLINNVCSDSFNKKIDGKRIDWQFSIGCIWNEYGRYLDYDIIWRSQLNMCVMLERILCSGCSFVYLLCIVHVEQNQPIPSLKLLRWIIIQFSAGNVCGAEAWASVPATAAPTTKMHTVYSWIIDNARELAPVSPSPQALSFYISLAMTQPSPIDAWHLLAHTQYLFCTSNRAASEHTHTQWHTRTNSTSVFVHRVMQSS